MSPRRRSPARYRATALTTLLAACGEPIAPVVPEPDLPTRAETTDTADAAQGGADATDGRSENGCLLAPPTDLRGVWALDETQTALVSNVPAIGTMVQTSKSLYLIEIAPDPSNPSGDVMRARLCDWETRDEHGLTTTAMNPALLPVMATLDRTVRLEEVAAGPGNTEPRLVTSDGIQLRGLVLTDPATDAFPTALDDPRLRDEDGDSHPGVTLFLNGLFPGTLHVAHRHTARLDGCFTEVDTVSGLTTWTTEQLILGAEPEGLMDVQPDAQTHPDPALSFFTLRRAAPSGTPVTDCESLKTAREALFPPARETP